MSDLITLVDNEVPIDTYYVLQVTEKKMLKLVDSASVVDNLPASVFINSSGKLLKLSSEILQYMAEGITFFRFYFSINPTQEYARIKRDPFCFQFDLRLPQQNFYTVTNKVGGISSLEKKISSSQ